MNKLSSFYCTIVKCFLFLFFLCSLSSHVLAIHDIGAEMSYEYISPHQYKITLKKYYDCRYIPSYTNIPHRITWSDGVRQGHINLPFERMEHINSGAYCSNSLGVQVRIFSATVSIYDIGGGNNGDIQLHTTVYTNIHTYNVGNSFATYVEVIIPRNNIINSSPTLAEHPLFRSCNGENILYFRPALDKDGDSLVYSLTHARSSPTSPLAYNAGFSSTSPLGTSTPVLINSLNGTLSFTAPNFMGKAGIVIKIEEYRGGSKIAESIHSYAYEVHSCVNNSPVLSGIDSTNSYNKIHCPNTSHCFTVYATDIDSNDIPSLELVNPPTNATFSSYWDTVTQTTVGQFCWTPSITDTGTHHIYIRVVDSVHTTLITKITQQYEILVSNPNPPINITAPPSLACAGDTLQLLCTTTATNIDSFSWSSSYNNIVTPDSLQTAVIATQTAIYKAYARYSDGCSESKQVRVAVNSPPNINLTKDTLSRCVGNSTPAQLINTARGHHYSYSWRDLNIGQSGYPLFSLGFSPHQDTFAFAPYNTAGVYAFEGTTLDTVTGCSVSDTIYYEVVAPQNFCGHLYVTPTANHTGAGSPNDPVSLRQALLLAKCDNTIIKLAVGTYFIDDAIQLASGLTIEGGFLPNKNWTKTSQAGATVIHRTNLNPAGTYNIDQNITAIEAINISDFRLQDLTIHTDSATILGMSTYGIFLHNASNYNITRVQIAAGNAGDGVAGADGCGRNSPNGGVSLDGAAGTNGADGAMSSNNSIANGGTGGAAGLPCGSASFVFGGVGGAGNGTNGGDGPYAMPGPIGHPSIAIAPEGGSGGGGGAGGQGNTNGGNGGNSGDGGAPFSPPNIGPSATVSGLRGAAALGGFGGIGGPVRQDGQNGTDGFDGIDGRNGNNIPSTFSPPTSRHAILQSEHGEHGSAGSGGAGGGGGGGTFGGLPIVPGTGNAGGGGGGGAAAGSGGEGGYAGGSSFGIYVNNSPNGAIKDCFIQTGTGGQGGQGGTGGTGGIGGNGGLGGTLGTNTSNVSYITAGGNGGRGGNGGDGGDGGDGMDGISQAIYIRGTAPSRLDSNFNLQAQAVIEVTDINGIHTDVEFLATTASIGNTTTTTWDFDRITNAATPNVSTANPTRTQYSQMGRYTLSNTTDFYTDFHLIDASMSIVVDSLKNNSSLSTPNGSIRVSAQNGTAPYTYQWSANAGNSTNNTITNLGSDTYCVTITDATGCEKTKCMYIDYGIQYARNSTSQTFLMSPNPAGVGFRITTNKILNNTTINICNTLGQLVHQTPLVEQTLFVDTKELPIGVYWVSLQQNNKIISSKKLIIAR